MIATTQPIPWTRLASLYSANQVRELDRCIIQAGTPGIVLMKRAAAAVLNELLQRWPNTRQLLVVCGRGNNGGDGFLLAKLALEKGLQVQLLAVGMPPLDQTNNAVDIVDINDSAKAGDADRARQAYSQLGDELVTIENIDVGRIEVVVDALLGTGLSGPTRSPHSEAIAFINQLDKPVIAVDVPSGLCSNSGQVLGEQAVYAAATVSFIGHKKGLFTGQAAEQVGDVIFDSLGATADELRQVVPEARLCSMQVLANSIPHRNQNTFKQSFGHVLVIGGEEGMGGAVSLCAQAAARSGAGLVSVATRQCHAVAMIAGEPALMVQGVEEPQALLPLLDKATTVAIGPGLGRSEWAKKLFAAVLQYFLQKRSLPLVADADALNALAADAGLAEIWQQWRTTHADTAAVITPHPGEARRLSNNGQRDRYQLVEQLQRDYLATTVLKGSGTLIASGDQTLVCPYGNAVLATAGSGDVLSGVIAALLAQGLEGLTAASLAVCLHGLAADHYLENNGAFGLTASDLPQRIAGQMNRFQPR